MASHYNSDFPNVYWPFVLRAPLFPIPSSPARTFPVCSEATLRSTKPRPDVPLHSPVMASSLCKAVQQGFCHSLTVLLWPNVFSKDGHSHISKPKCSSRARAGISFLPPGIWAWFCDCPELRGCSVNDAETWGQVLRDDTTPAGLLLFNVPPSLEPSHRFVRKPRPHREVTYKCSNQELQLRSEPTAKPTTRHKQRNINKGK